MKSFSGLSIAFFISIFLCTHIAVSQEIPEIIGEEIPGIKVNRNECFDGSSLWGYMNGGADIYLEYGFGILRVEEFSIEDEIIKMELYKMHDPLSAFGTYSIKTFKCKQSDVIVTPDCMNRFQFQLVYGDYYLQLISESGSERTKQLMIDIARILLSKLEYKELKLPCTYLSDSLGFSHSEIKMLKGELGIQDKAMDLVDCFNKLEEYQVYYAKTLVDREKVKYYEIVFDEPEMKNKFMECNKGFQIIEEDCNRILIKK
ncbi:DUF6599 family protein [Bacteroidota bacterium]